VRNAIDHGIETPQQRMAAGKPGRATIRLTVSLRAEQVAICIADDGQGIDIERVKASAAKRRLALAPDEADVLRVIFEPGFSTAHQVTHVSGRGVGLDVVKSQVEAMRGSVEVTTEAGRGTAFTLLVPLTVTTLRVLFVRVGSEMFGLPSSSIQRLVRVTPSEIGMIEGREMLLLDAAPIPIVSLAELLGCPSSAPPVGQDKLPLVVTRQQNQTVALAVDELLREQDVLCKPLGGRIGRMRNISAAMVLPTGRVALLLRPSDLVRLGVSRAPASRAVAGFGATSETVAKRALLVDDSATTRTLERSILEAAGYDVLVAVDGKAAWLLLQEKGADIVVSDVEMPNMDGFVLTETIRASKRFRDLPVILLTSLDSVEDRARVLESGANAYLVKSAFDQTNLLETIRQLL
jgi:two-component system chemotaxis sensor kinase CheA